MNTIKPINQFNSNLYNAYNKSTSSNSDNNNSDLDFSQNLKEQETDEYIKTPTTKDTAKELYNLFKIKEPVTNSDGYNANDISLGITFADRNSNILPTINNINSGDDSVTISDTNTSIHTTLDGTRFLVVQTNVGEQTFEKNIKLNETL